MLFLFRTSAENATKCKFLLSSTKKGVHPEGERLFLYMFRQNFHNQTLVFSMINHIATATGILGQLFEFCRHLSHLGIMLNMGGFHWHNSN